MHCTSCCKIFLPFHSAEGSYERSSQYGNYTLPCGSNMGVMFVLRASTTLSLLLLHIHLCAYLLVKLFIALNRRAACQSYVEPQGEKDPVLVGVEECSVDGDLVADVILGGEGLLFLDKGAAGRDDALLAEQVIVDCKDKVSLEAEDTFHSESAYDSPVEETLEFECHGDHVLKTDAAEGSIASSCDSDTFQEQEVGVAGRSEENKEGITEGGKYSVVEIKLDYFNLDRENNIGGSLAAGESTSKSSVEWRGSTICRDSETEYPFSSSSRRSSSHWESYTVFRKYDEEMLFFDKISEQKLTETESFRSIKARPRSISRRILGKFTSKEKNTGGCWQGGRDPHHELENAYVAQVCLTWEALNWNYNNFRRGMSETGCPAVVAQQFQQFQVLLQRFIENEPYERGPRPEVFARVRISSPKLLLVPEFHDDDDDDDDEAGSKVAEGILDYSRISSSEFMAILEDAIRTFMSFLRADRDKCCQKLRAFILRRKRSSSVDPTFVHLLKKVNKKKKLRVKELGGRCSFMSKRKLNEDKELEILMALIDMKVVSRVLRMPGITEQQLHWCEEKMSKVRVWDGRMQRDSLPLLFFPAH